MPDHDVQWHLQELARRVMACPAERLRIIREYHAELVAAGDVFSANVILTVRAIATDPGDRKSTRLNSSHLVISYAAFCLKKEKQHPLRGHLARTAAPAARSGTVALPT